MVEDSLNIRKEPKNDADIVGKWTAMPDAACWEWNMAGIR